MRLLSQVTVHILSGAMRQTRRLLTVLAVLGAGLVLTAGAASAASPHEVTQDPITCVLNANNTVTCSGSVAGLGNQAVIARINVKFACATRGNASEPGGHLQAQTQPIQTRNGRITFSVTSGPAKCPPGLVPVVGKSATVTLLNRAGAVLFQVTKVIQR